MKHTKANVIKLLETMQENAEAVSKILRKQGYEEAADAQLWMAFGLEQAVKDLKDPKAFNSDVAIFFKEACHD